MSREIKFRGKSIETGEWVYGHLAYIDNAGAVIANERGGISVFRASVGQYTGLKGKNGVEVYDGDIVPIRLDLLDASVGGGKRKWFTFNLFVAWDDIKCGWHFEGPPNEFRRGQVHDMSGHRGKEYEVIGNIYENPELLGAK